MSPRRPLANPHDSGEQQQDEFQIKHARDSLNDIQLPLEFQNSLLGERQDGAEGEELESPRSSSDEGTPVFN